MVPVPTVLQGVEAIKGKIVVNVYNNGGGGSGGGGVAPEPCPVMPVDQTFGLNNSNAIVPEGNFAALIAYAKNHNLTVREPFRGSVIIDGIEYKGELTEIRDADGAIVSTYFHPDASSGPFQTGFHYNIGNKGPDGTSATNSPVSLPGFSNPPSYGSSPIIYAPTGSGSTGLSPTQRQALENADNIRLLQLLQQEDALDDALPSSCHGTARNGNVMWPGTAEHWLIQFDYIAEHPLALKEYYVPGSSGKLNGNPGYAAIANPVTGEMFEIKPGNPNAQSAGATEIQLYVSQANALCPRVGGGGWSAGGNYSTRYLPDPRNPANLLEAKLSSNGVIVYGSKSRNGLPQPVPVALPQDMTEKLKRLSMRIKANPNTMQPQVITFVRENPSIIPYLKTAAAAVIIGTLLEDIITEGIGIADDWLSFLIARTLWRAGNGIIII